MSRFLLDLNLLLALLDPMHVFHEPAHAWVAVTPRSKWITCPIVQNGVIRVASQSKYPNPLGTVAEVMRILRAFCQHSRHEFVPDDISLLDSFELAQPEMLTPSRVTDLYLLALAQRHKAKLATFDGRIPFQAIRNGKEAFHLIDPP